MFEALDLYRELGDLSNESAVQCNLGVGAYLMGQWTEALDWFRSYQETARRAGNVANVALAGSNIGEMLVRRGELDEAMPILREAVRIMRSSGFADGAAYAEIQIGRLLVCRGAFSEADVLLERTGAEMRQLGTATSALEAACVRAEAKAFLGQSRESQELLESAVDAAGDAARAYGAQIAIARTQALAAAAQAEEALATVETGLESARRDGMPYEEALLMSYRIELGTRKGKGPDASDVTTLGERLASLGVTSLPRLADAKPG